MGGSGGLERIDFNSFYFVEEVVVLKDLILTVSTLGGGSGGLKRTDFNNFYFGEEVVVLKELILTISTLGRKWWS